MGPLGLRRPAVRLERPLRGPVPPRPPHLRLRRPQLPGQRHLLHPRRRGLPGPAGRRSRRLEAPCRPRPAARRPAPRPGGRPGAQRRAERQPPPVRRGSRQHPRPDGRLVRLRPADHRQFRASTWRPTARDSTTYWPVPSRARRPGEPALARALPSPAARPPRSDALTRPARPRSYARCMSEVYAVRRGRLRDRCAASAALPPGLPSRQRPLPRGRAPRGAVLLLGPTEDALLCPAPAGDVPTAAPTRRCG